MSNSFRSPTGRYIQWDAIIRECRLTPDTWLRLLPNERTRVAEYIKYKRHPKLEIEPHVLRTRITNKYVDDAGDTRGDLWLRIDGVQSQREDKRDD